MVNNTLHVTHQQRRKRGVILAIQGWQRLEAAKQKTEIEENDGKSYTLEQLSERTNLSLNTLMIETELYSRQFLYAILRLALHSVLTVR